MLEHEVTLRNPETLAEMIQPAAVTEYFLARGWVVVDVGAEAAAALAAAVEAEGAAAALAGSEPVAELAEDIADDNGNAETVNGDADQADEDEQGEEPAPDLNENGHSEAEVIVTGLGAHRK